MSELLSIRNLHKTFSEGGSEIRVLQGVDLDLAEGERLAVIGESGVGKSTLLHLIGALDRPTSGEILFSGRALPLDDEVALCRFRNREIGLIFQFHYLLPDFSALENVMFPALIQGVDRREAGIRAGLLLETVGLKNRMNHRPGKLSGGEQQRVAVARAVILQPKLVLADEPTGSLDLRIGEEVQDLLFQLNQERGIALVIATHNREFAKKIGRQVELKAGKLAAASDPADSGVGS
jgi:lipoprotein-releasing system ATP-binding protein